MKPWYRILSPDGRLMGCTWGLEAAHRMVTALAMGATVERFLPGGYTAALTAVRRANGAAKPHERQLSHWEPNRWHKTGVGRLIQQLHALAEISGEDGLLLGEAMPDVSERCRVADVLKRGLASRYGLRVRWNGDRLGAGARIWAISEETT